MPLSSCYIQIMNWTKSESAVLAELTRLLREQGKILIAVDAMPLLEKARWPRAFQHILRRNAA